jgi:hypothetical protein
MPVRTAQPGRFLRLAAAAAAVALTGVACADRPAEATSSVASGKPVAVYNKSTGRLQELDSDKNGDGKIDTRAFMDGATLLRIEIDRNGDGRTDRWEYYTPSPDGRSVVDHIFEANGPDDRITRREFYSAGVLQRVEDDTDNDGRPDKWEEYDGGVLKAVLLDLQGTGKPDRRLIYGADGNVERVEAADAAGAFHVLSQDIAPPPAAAVKTAGR